MKPKKDGKVVCPRCGAGDTQSRGDGDNGRKKYQCMTCGKYFRYPENIKRAEKVTETKDTRELSRIVSVRITNEQQLIEQCEIDPNVWEVERWTCEKKEELSYGEMKTLFHIKAWLKRKVAEVEARDAITELLEDAKKFAPKYKKISYPLQESGLLYEIDMADLHFGKLTWDEETGQNYDIDIAADIAKSAIVELLGYVKHLPIQKILMPAGNDFSMLTGRVNSPSMALGKWRTRVGRRRSAKAGSSW
jgi:DNA-directed RNA polymerase subunit RPC12/RpoP